jgi:hypothetical protein
VEEATILMQGEHETVVKSSLVIAKLMLSRFIAEGDLHSNVSFLHC